MAQPDPNQAPTVANFGPPPGSPQVPPAAAPGMNMETFSKVASVAPDFANVMSGVAAGQPPDPAAALRVLQAMGMAQGSAAAPANGNGAAAPAPTNGAKNVRPANGAAPAKPAVQQHFRETLNDLGTRLRNFFGEHLPGVHATITLIPLEDGEYDWEYISGIPEGGNHHTGKMHVLAANSAPSSALGECVYTTVAEAQSKLEEMDVEEEQPGDNLGGNY